MKQDKERKRIEGSRLRNLLTAIGEILLVGALVIGGAAVVLFHGEARTLMSIERVADADLFTMEYKADYGLDKLMETGVSSDAELVTFVTEQVLKGIPLKFDLPDLGCSTYAAQYADGRAIFGRNFDMYDSPALLVTTRPEDGYDSISMVNLAYIGYSADHLPESFTSSILTLCAPYVPLDGVNEKGLAVGVLLIDTEPTNQQTEKVDLTTTAAIRLMLDRAATVEEAVALLQSIDMHASANSCYHFHIADAKGGSVVVEYIGDEMSVVSSRAATNFLLTPGDYGFGKGQDRYETMINALEQTGGVMADEQAAMALLEAVSQTAKPGKERPSSTQWSCVYDQSMASVAVAMDMQYGEIYRFSLNGTK